MIFKKQKNKMLNKYLVTFMLKTCIALKSKLMTLDSAALETIVEFIYFYLNCTCSKKYRMSVT